MFDIIPLCQAGEEEEGGREERGRRDRLFPF